MYVILCALFLVTSCLGHSERTPSVEKSIFDGAFDFVNITRFGAPVLPIDPSIVEDAKATTIELARKYGYVAEAHSVITEDGYILQLHRISGGPKSPPKSGKKVCFIQHGILDSSGSSVLAGPNQGLAFILADQGWDVWMGNSRGNVYSTKHIKYNPFSILPYKRKQYWSFTWHEIGVYDLPASIDFVLYKTGSKKLQYIGHSQGTTAFFVMLSEKPEYNDKIEKMHALAPIAYVGHVVSPPIKGLTMFLSMLQAFVSTTGIHFIPSTKSIPVWAAAAYKPVQVAATNTLMAILGFNTDQMNSTLLPVILGHVPAGCSSKQLFHYGQLVNSGRFRNFDYGFLGNMRHYKQRSPPEYNLKNVKVPVALYYSPNDWLSVVQDVQILKSELPNVIKDYAITGKLFNHMDLLWGVDAPALVYNELLKSMNGVDENVNS